jgi:chemotaxis methyl-accepting protein methylase/signal transduction histidine kinase
MFSATKPSEAVGSKTTATRGTPIETGRASVVGIGASAGGLEALKAFFGAMPPKPGLTFVVVVHLDPTHESLMPELLAKCTALTVEQARDRQPLEADHVYIIPPNRSLTIEQGLIRVREVADRRGLRGAIDYFFRSLADDQHEKAVCVVLSGTGTEGTLGLRAVKATGGMVMAQSPDTASQPGMPSSAIATGLVDFVLAPEKMSEALLKYVRNAQRPGAAPAAVQPLDDLQRVLAVLRTRTKYDFRGYKKGTLQRRIERRMGLHQLDRIGKYVDFLRAHPTETDQLFKDLFIGVTSFFRDPEAFDELATKVLASLVKDRDPDVPIRIWVPGCSTGEEAYSIAILVAEQMSAAQSSCRVQIFATDVDEDALEVARGGAYPESIALDVTPQRLRRFFTHDDHRYTIAKPIRESVVFAAQNLISDPPFSKLDLVACRNVMIYLEPEVQEKVLTLFHFALNPGGHLFLGSADGLGSLEEQFAPVSKRRRIFRRLGLARRPPLELPEQISRGEVARLEATSIEPTVATLADRQFLEHFAPTGVVVKRSGQIVRFYGDMERYIAVPPGEATLDILMLARDALKPTIRAALHEAVRMSHPTTLEAADVTDQGRANLRISVRPLDAPSTAESLWLVIFEKLPQSPSVKGGTTGKQSELVRKLELELRATKKEQQHLIEQLESGNEELKAANEEVLSMNEELQSTNEELVTSKEELQSMNEELTTLNAQLQDKVQEITAANDDLANLLVSTDIATVFVDTEFRIKRFTTAATQLLNLLPSDRGRPINHLATNLIGIDLAADARAVLNSLAPIEKEVAAHDGRQYIVRVVPYRTEDKYVQGVVLTLVDVTALKKAQQELEVAKERLAADLRRMSSLHALSTELAGPAELPVLLDNIIHTALEVTGADMGNIQVRDETGSLRVVAQSGFKPPFLDFFRRVRAETDSACGTALASRQRVFVRDVEQSPVFRDSPSRSVLVEAGVRAVQSTPLVGRMGEVIGMLSTHYRTSVPFGETDERWLDLLARQATQVIERKRSETLLEKAKSGLERQVGERTKWLALMHGVTRAIAEAQTWDEALQATLRHICEGENWQVGYVYVPADQLKDPLVVGVSYVGHERFQPFHRVAAHLQYASGQSLPGRVYADSVPIWVTAQDELLNLLPLRREVAGQVGLCAAVALPITIGQRVMAVLELFSDRPHEASEELVTLMTDVSIQMARVLEREHLTAEMADLVWREQQNLMHTLHDSLGQTLTGLGMLSAGLSSQLVSSDPSLSETAGQIAHQAQQALQDVRQLSKGLFPIEVDSDSLMGALRQLAVTTESLHGLRVRVEGELPLTAREGRVVTQLYRIAQEAVTNALKHAQARTITIGVSGDSGRLRLSVADDGVGIQSTTPSQNGLGLRIMRFRATSIGGQLTVEPVATGGTIVTCTVREAPRPPGQMQPEE